MKREHKIFITFVFLLSLYISAHEHFNADLKQDANSNTGNVLNAGLQMQGDGAAVLNARQNSIKGEDEAALFKETNGDLGEGIENKTTPLSAEKSGAIKNNTIYKAQDGARAAKRGFDGLNLNAKSVFVYDLTENKEIFARDGEKQFPLASLTKLMTAVAAADNLSRNAVLEI